MIDINKKYQTRDGRAVRILCVDGPTEDQPVVGIIDGETDINQWTSDGISFPWAWSVKETIDKYRKFDLVPVPTKHEGWMVFDRSSYALYTTKEAAQRALRQDIGSQIADVVAHATWED
jgi:hypothetical protein